MSRKFYETEEDRNKELKFAKDLEGYWEGTKLVKLQFKYFLDFAITRQKKVSTWEETEITGWCEVKHREIKSKGKYFPPKYIILSFDKWKNALDYACYTKKPFVFAVRIDDGKSGDYMFVHNYGDDTDYEVQIGGRVKEKRDDGDVEPVVKLPFSKFKRLDK